MWAGLGVGAVIGVAIAMGNRPALNEQVRCPHCGTTGQVLVSVVERKRGISGGKATGAVMTGGLSLFATGLSRHESVRHLECGNCHIGWDVS